MARISSRLVALGVALLLSNVLHAAPKPKTDAGGWAPKDANTLSLSGTSDPAYAAYDAGRYEDALKLATEAAGRGEAQANTLIGDMYEEGLGVTKDNVKAAEWFTKGAVAGDMHAQFRLGVMLGEGRGIKKDKKKSGRLF